MLAMKIKAQTVEKNKRIMPVNAGQNRKNKERTKKINNGLNRRKRNEKEEGDDRTGQTEDTERKYKKQQQ